jgi:glycosyltransferase involved in cell wall biosynthesis
MRIIIVSQTYSYGNGQGSFTIQLAENMTAQGHQVLVVIPAESMKSYNTSCNDVQIEHVAAIHLSILHPNIYITPFPTVRIRQIFQEFKPDVVHIQDHYFLCGAAVNEARRLHIPVMGTNHFLPENLLPFARKFPILQKILSVPLWKMMLAVFNKLDLATTPSHTAAHILREQNITVPVHAISNGVDIQRFRPDPQMDRLGMRRKYGLSPDRIILLYVGRLDGEKRIDTLLDAMSLLPRDDFQLAIAGFGLYEPQLRKQMHDLDLEGRVIFIGYVPPEDLPSLYNSADIFVMPSPEELQSIATLEAMASGKPILAAGARALPELVKPGANGYLFRACDPQNASQKMELILNEKEKWTSMGQASMQRVKNHSVQNTINYFEDDYRKIMEATPIRRRKPTATRKLLKKVY